jgi:isopentenyl-diphosphate Delta-isomerase
VTAERELQRVELVSPEGVREGSSTVAEAHTAPGRLHRAFSVVLLDAGRTLMQQRAAGKTRFPLRWTNACCGHPSPGEPVSVAARRRLTEELGLTGLELREAGIYVYRAADPATGRVEWEYDHVLVGQAPAGVAVVPDPDEVAAVEWVAVRELRERLVADGGADYSPWLSGVLDIAL